MPDPAPDLLVCPPSRPLCCSVYGGNASIEFVKFFNLGVDGVFADFPDHAVYASRLYEQFLREGGTAGTEGCQAFRNHLVHHALAMHNTGS